MNRHKIEQAFENLKLVPMHVQRGEDFVIFPPFDVQASEMQVPGFLAAQLNRVYYPTATKKVDLDDLPDEELPF